MLNLTYACSQSLFFCLFFFFNDTATTEIYTLSLHDALPISLERWRSYRSSAGNWPTRRVQQLRTPPGAATPASTAALRFRCSNRGRRLEQIPRCSLAPGAFKLRVQPRLGYRRGAFRRGSERGSLTRFFRIYLRSRTLEQERRSTSQTIKSLKSSRAFATLGSVSMSTMEIGINTCGRVISLRWLRCTWTDWSPTQRLGLPSVYRLVVRSNQA